MQTIDLITLIPRCHEAAKAKGFWDVTPPMGQQLMLGISELSEALEAHRKGNIVDPLNVQGILNTLKNCPQYFETRFQANIKDTEADELADAYIRLCDYAGGFGLDIDAINVGRAMQSIDFDRAPDTFAEMMLGLTEFILDIYHATEPAKALGEALAGIEYVAGQCNIDLATHIDLKLRYNATRPYKHAKAY